MNCELWIINYYSTERKDASSLQMLNILLFDNNFKGEFRLIIELIFNDIIILIIGSLVLIPLAFCFIGILGRLARYAIKIDILLVLSLPWRNIGSDWIFFLCNFCELQITQEKNILDMKSSQELCKLEYICFYYYFYCYPKLLLISFVTVYFLQSILTVLY